MVKQIEKIVGDRYTHHLPSNVTTQEYNRIMRGLMCRIIDVEEMFPGGYENYDEVKDRYLIDFLLPEDERDFTYAVEPSRNGVYKLVVTDWGSDHRVDIVINVPSFILEDDWYNNVESQRIIKRIAKIDKEINRIETIMASGTGQIMELNKEKSDLEYALQNCKQSKE
jgi:hypothetical protein